MYPLTNSVSVFNVHVNKTICGTTCMFRPSQPEDLIAPQTAEYVTAKMNEYHGGEADFLTFAAIAFEPIQSLEQSLDLVQDEPEWAVQFIGMSYSQWAEEVIKPLPVGVLNNDANEYGDECTIRVRMAAPSPLGHLEGPPYKLSVNSKDWIVLRQNLLGLRNLKVRLVDSVVAVPAAEAPNLDGGAAAAPSSMVSGGGLMLQIATNLDAVRALNSREHGSTSLRRGERTWSFHTPNGALSTRKVRAEERHAFK